MAKITIKTSHTRERLIIPDRARQRVSEYLLELNKERIYDRVDANGQAFPEGVDFIESGELLRNTFADPDGYTFAQPYAETLEANVAPGFGLPPEALERPEVESDLAKILEEEGLELEEEK